MVLLQPELQVREQEMEHLRLAVIEALGPPGGMLSLRTRVEELILRAVEHVDALDGVFDGMGVYQIQQNGDAEFVGAVHQILKFLGIAEAAGSGEKVGDLIAERAVIGMFHDGHKLHGVVTEVFHTRQDTVRKLAVGAGTIFLSCHADMRLIDQRNRIRMKAPIGPGKRLCGIPHFTDPVVADRVLNHASRIERDVIGEFVTVLYDGTDTAAVPQSLFRQTQLPVAVFQTCQGMRGLVPVVEVTHEIECVSGRSPLTVDPAFEGVMKTVVFMCIGKVSEAAIIHQRIAHAMIVVHAEFNIPFERNQSPVLLKNAKHGKASFYVEIIRKTENREENDERRNRERRSDIRLRCMP